MSEQEILKRIAQNNSHGEELVRFIENEIPLLRKAAMEKYEQKLANEVLEKNKQLKLDLEYWKRRVVELEVMNGIEQYELPDKNKPHTVTCNSSVSNKTEISSSNSASKIVKVEETNNQPKQTNKEPKKETKKEAKKEKSGKTPKPQTEAANDENKEVNVSRLDLRVGRILAAKKHPDAESLYVEEIDVGEDKPRTVVSGLVKYVPLEEMQNRLVVVLCNLKPAKMRGITSEAMVMCASTPEKVEILCPPSDSVPGDRVVCEEYPGEPDALLNPKKKVFEQVAPDLKTNDDCLATFKSALLKVSGKGVIKSGTLKSVQIK